MTEARRVTLSSIAIRDFRNIAAAEIAIPPDGIAIVGDNGHGKTNLLEAVAYLELLRSIRGVRDRDLIRFGASAFHIAAEAGAASAERITAGVDRAGAKRSTLDGVEQPRRSDALGALPSVWFAPADVALVAGAPGERRRYLDIALALTSRRYLHSLRLYRSALARRNAVLKEAGRNGARAPALAAWEPALAEHGAVIVEERRAWVTEFDEEFTRIGASIGERARLEFHYESPVAGADDVRASLTEALERGRDHDLHRGLTHTGPHRDDLAVSLGGRDLRVVGSAGQHRTASIALRFLEAATFRTRTGVQPVLLLDDPFAELDRSRADAVLALLDQSAARGFGQAILCVPRAEEVPPEFTRLDRWTVRDGAFTAA